ncbi:50S ribosomal protein L24 [Kamptonema cortianum]|nr:50S ribosomal protein L24 [Geitlerinema splendidum]MDK3160420.1 50S ribosomal protein L24 [Kamptonema cortianum]
MPTKAELKKAGKKIKLRLRTGDTVMIIAGKDKGQIGTIAAISPTERKAIVIAENPENPDQPLPLNAIVKHRKARYQGEKSARIKLPAPIDLSNLMLIEPDKKQPTRVGRRIEDGKIVRYAKKTGKTLVDTPNITKE